MGSHDRDIAARSGGTRGLGAKHGGWTSEEAANMETRQKNQRMSPARRFFFVFLVSSLILLGLISVHSPRLWQRISCHKKMSGHKVEVEMEGEGESPNFAAVLVDKESPQALDDLLHQYLPSRFHDKSSHPKRRRGPANPAGEAAVFKLFKRETNSSVVDPGSSTPATASSDPEAPSSTGVSPTPSGPTSSLPQSSETKSSSTPSQPPPPPPPPTTSKTSNTPSNPTSNRPPPTTTAKPTTSSTRAPPANSDNTDDTTLSTTTSNPLPATPTVIVETSTRTSNGEVVIVESTITVQPSPTDPVSATQPPRNPPSLQNSAARQETRGLITAVLFVAALMGVLLL